MKDFIKDWQFIIRTLKIAFYHKRLSKLIKKQEIILNEKLQIEIDKKEAFEEIECLLNNIEPKK
jgi:hypothetical protein